MALTGANPPLLASRAARHRDRNPRRAYDHDGREIRPMDLRNMREHGVRSVAAICQVVGCGHSGSVNVDHLLGQRLRAVRN
jgi:hypothetical protein